MMVIKGILESKRQKCNGRISETTYLEEIYKNPIPAAHDQKNQWVENVAAKNVQL